MSFKNFLKISFKSGRNFVDKLSKLPYRYTMIFVSDYYKKLTTSENFKLAPTAEDA